MGKFLKRGDFKQFVLGLSKKYQIIAPIKTDIIRFEKITAKNIDLIDFSANSRVSPIRYFFPFNEEVVEFKNGKGIPKLEKVKQTIILGIRNCDANALRSLDKMLMSDYFRDPVYEQKRKNTILFIMRCDEPKETCFCQSMDSEECYDARFINLGDEGFSIELISEIGKKLIEENKIVTNAEKKLPERKSQTLSLDNKNIANQYNNPIWETDSKKCFSCTACNMLCPTCTCFDIKDIANADLKSGTKIKTMDSCHNRDFTKVAGNYVFRDKRVDRYKHRIYHKIAYFKERFNMYMCTGCGRCISQCPSKINWVEMCNKLK
jgi:ferredoxin